MFGQGSRAPVAITLLVRNPAANHEGCRILYHDVGDYLKRKEKLTILREAESIAGVARVNTTGWRRSHPDKHHDWVAQRDAAFQGFYPVGTKEAKAGKSNEAVFKLYSGGYKTGRDAYVYNFSAVACRENASRMIEGYSAAGADLRDGALLSDVTQRYSADVKWDADLKRHLSRDIRAVYEPQQCPKDPVSSVRSDSLLR